MIRALTTAIPAPTRRSRRAGRTPASVGNTLRYRVFAWLGIVCVVVTLAAVSTQLAVLHKRSQVEITSTFERITFGLIDSLEYAFSQNAETQVEHLLDTLHGERDVSYVQLSHYDGRIMVRGQTDGIEQHRTFALNRVEGQREWERIGTLTVGTSMARAHAALRADLPNLLITSFLIGLAATFLAAGIIDRLVLRHVQSVARQVSGAGENAHRAVVQLDRSAHGRSDELDRITYALNALRRKIAVNEWDESTREEKDDAPITKPVSDERKQAEFGLTLAQKLTRPSKELSDLADMLPGSKDPETAALIQNVQHEARAMRRAVRSSFEFSNQLAQPISPSEVDCDALVRDIAEAAKPDIVAAKARIAIAPIGNIFTDRAALEMVLRTLLQSALENALTDRDLVLSFGAGSSVSKKVNVIVIEDSGESLGEDAIDMNVSQLSPSATLDTDTSRVDDLILCGRLMEKFGGQMRVKSTPGIGCQVTILLANV